MGIIKKLNESVSDKAAEKEVVCNYYTLADKVQW